MAHGFGGRDRTRVIGYPFSETHRIRDRNMATHHEQTAHKHGEMDIRAQEKTFAGFIRAATWVCIISAAVLIFMALANS